MSSFPYETFINSTISEALSFYVHEIVHFLFGTLEALQENETLATILENIPESLSFNDFQWTLFKGFLIVLVINILLICAAWRIYGKNICERFMKPATSKAIEELKASVSRLKLPKEHTPRI